MAIFVHKRGVETIPASSFAVGALLRSVRQKNKIMALVFIAVYTNYPRLFNKQNCSTLQYCGKKVLTLNSATAMFEEFSMGLRSRRRCIATSR